MKELEINEIHSEMMHVLETLDRICEENNIQYVLAYGTLIGAIRHDGFIPWDDDVDIWMPRADYNRFIAYCMEHEEQIKPYKLCTRYNIDNYVFYISRFSNMEYKYQNTNGNKHNFDIGIFLDIYPIDNYGNGGSETEKLFKKTNFWSSLYCVYVNSDKAKNLGSRVIKACIHLALNLIFKNNVLSGVDQRITHILEHYSDESNEYVGCVCWAENKVLHKRNDVFNSDGTMNRMKHSFEGKEFYVPTNYHAILKNSYGDYMKLPPKEQQVPSHDYIIYKR